MALLLDALENQMRQGCRVSPEQALGVLHGANLFDLGRLASIRRSALHGNLAYYTVNLHINVSNLCVNHCKFCAFRRERGQAGAYELSPEEVWAYTERMAPPGIREFHVVAGLHPEYDLGYFETVLRGLRERFPSARLKAFTAVEIAHQAKICGIPVDEVLLRLKRAGLESLTGGGAETLSPRVRALVCPEKLDGEGYLDIHRRAHRLGIHSTATLLFGHVETPEERLDHLSRLRALQDESLAYRTGHPEAACFTAFVPLVFHPANTGLSEMRRIGARDILQMIALSRIVLDNFAHIKAYWVSLGPKLAQVALAWGADDLDGTVAEERIHHSAGATSPDNLTASDLRHLITEAGREPVERDAVYSGEPRSGQSLSDNRNDFPAPYAPLPDARLSAARAESLLSAAPLLELGSAASEARWRLHPEREVTYIIDRNINTTNQCESRCAFCAFACDVGDPKGWILSREQIAQKIDELFSLGGRQVLMQGGLHPQLNLEWYEDLFGWMRLQWPDLHIHSLSPPEIKYLAQHAGLGWRETIARLRDAGLGSLPGGGAEILCDRVRSALSPGKCTADEWIGIMRAAHQEGLRSTATMVIGFGETMVERVEHLERVRALQDETGGFTAFIPWTFQPRNTPLDKQNAACGMQTGPSLPAVADQPSSARSPFLPTYSSSAVDYLRTLAVSRLYLDNIPNIQASWVTQGRDIAQLALLFGANDLGSTMIEENVVAAAGTRFRLGPGDLEEIAAELGLRARRRDVFYRRENEGDL